MQIKIQDRLYNIRKSGKDDYRFCYNLTKNNMFPFYKKYNLEWKPKSFRKAFNFDFTKIITLNNKRIGVFSISFKENHLHIDNLQISNRYRGKGIGTKILKIIEKIAKKENNNIITLKIFTENKAINLYKKVGYKIIEEKDNKYLMQKYI